MKLTFILLFAVNTAIVLFTMFKNGNFFKNMLKTIIQGITSLMAVNVLGLLTGVTIAVNWYTLITVSLFGVPSTISLILLDAFLN